MEIPISFPARAIRKLNYPMKRTHLAKLFGSCGIVLVALSLNTLLASQGGNALLKLPVADMNSTLAGTDKQR